MEMVKILLWLGLSILSGILYRLGGSAKRGNWLDFARNSKTRDVGCPLVLLGLVWVLFGLKWHFWWAYLATFGLSWGGLTTYWDWLFGYDNFYAHGFFCGLAGIPLLWAGVAWPVILARLTLCTVGMGLWSKFVGNDVQEELGRGLFFIL